MIKRMFLALLRSELCQEAVSADIASTISADTLKPLYSISKSHDLTHFIAQALHKLGALGDDEVSAKFNNSSMSAVMRYQRINYEYNRICAAFEAAGIDYIPLKGSVIREHYATPWMRTSCDIDILVREEAVDSAYILLTEKLSYKGDQNRNFHDVSMFSPSGVHLELHFNIKEGIEPMDSVLSRVWECSSKVDTTAHKYLQSDEFLVFHIIAHAAYHFMAGGCGIRPFRDLWLLKRDLKLDSEKLDALLSEAGLQIFAREMILLSDVLFGDAKHNEVTQNMLDYILGAGVYGTLENKVAMSRKNDSGAVYLWLRIFLPLRTLQNLYPRLGKYPVLYPFYTVKRWFKILFKHDKSRVINEIKYNATLTDDRQRYIAELKNSLGINK